LENIVFTRRQQPYPRDDAQARIASARLAAEALFAAKPAVEEPPLGPDPETAAAPNTETAEPPVRKPRVLSIVPRPAVGLPPAATPPPNGRKPRLARTIPRAQHSRIRTWVTYGMTATEVAQLYGAAVGEVERILGKAGGGGAGANG
jgi:hypothetical protein